MTKITKQYDNANNGGRERITRDGDSYYISSDWGQGFCAATKITRSDAQMCLEATSAPDDVVSAILG